MATLRKTTTNRKNTKRPVKKEPTAAFARSVMTADPETVIEETSLYEAAALMAELGVRHLPVVNELGVLVGMLSDRDLRTSIGDPVEALRGRRDESEACVRDVMAPDPLRVGLSTPISEIAMMLMDERIGAVPVVDEGDRPIGIVSYVDLIRFLTRNT
jgi:CBS domain-containing protein